MNNFKKNNLDKSSSPYLQQHKDNPIHWQKWNKETLEYAKKENKLIFVSIGYSTCHWCHVMASEAFSDQDTANYLNSNFVAIKVDREQRPDIDSYFMDFANQTTGRGGWPLNVVLSPEAKPFFAGTYFPHVEKNGIKPLIYILQEVKKWYAENSEKITAYTITNTHTKSENIDDLQITKKISAAFDKEFGGFGIQTKFPPHNTLLMLLNFYQETKSDFAKEMILKTLDAMSNNGLQDHLQGGFYRYCVDREWQIPHFEKMLYDQAMLLWVYADAYRLFNREQDKIIISKIIKGLGTFSDGNGLFYSAHDADTNHEEGATYLWANEELKQNLSEDEYIIFSKTYDISTKGNFEGKNHLVKKYLNNLKKSDKQESIELFRIEEKLLTVRKKKMQPFIDKKILTSWNALVGIGSLLAYRCTGEEDYITISNEIFDQIIEKHYTNGILAHSSLDAELQTQEFLEDYASMLLIATYLYEENNFNGKRVNKYKKYIQVFLKGLDKFKEPGGQSELWYANITQPDFKQVHASAFDHPTPSAKSLTEMAIFRSHIILGKETKELEYNQFLENDFHNLVAYYTKGNFHELHAPEKIDFKNLPINSLVKKGEKFQDCTNFSCNEYNNKTQLLNALI